MDLKQGITNFSIRRAGLVTGLMVAFTLVLGALIPRIRVDTDPENMLSADEPVRVFHDENKERFTLSDMVVVGVVNETHPNGVFNAQSLANVFDVTQFAKNELQWPDPDDPDKTIGVIDIDLLAPSTVDHIAQGGPGEVTFEWLMPRPPATDEEALAIRDKALSNPLLKDTLISHDGQALALYIPLTSKDLSYRVYSALQKKIATFSGADRYHITGLPVAEDTFGVEMFIQMAISAPLAMLVIFLLMLLFFRKLVLVISPMIVAMVAVISAMGLLIGFGFPVHIMSSMIPIFLMPIAVVDSVHILSEFFDVYTPAKGRQGTIREVMDDLFVPMLYTSLTSAAGFASLALTPIPPVQVFGVFVAIGIMIAWLATVTFVPAYVMFIPEKSLANFGHAAQHGEDSSWLGRPLARTGWFTYRRAKPIMAVLAVLSAVAVWGITRIHINDNPVKWFSRGHPIRVADTELNRHFGGTYMAYLVLETDPEVVTDVSRRIPVIEQHLQDLVAERGGELVKLAEAVQAAQAMLHTERPTDATIEAALDSWSAQATGKAQTAEDAEDLDLADAWYEMAAFFEMEKERLKLFKQPEVLAYIDRLEQHLLTTDVVGKSNSIAGIVKKVHQEMIDGRPENYRVPDNLGAVAQCLLQYQSSHRPHDLWHFVRSDFSAANVWVQLTSGDNRDMEKVVRSVDAFVAENPPPVPIHHRWAGLTYINVVWQNKMVWGMLQSFLGSFLIVFLMMAVLFRSPLWGLVCMVPLTITIVMIYGVIGLVGKDYDMPVAVLSALTLGMAVDFAIHFLQRARAAQARTGSWERASEEVFGEPARAISRNVLVIAIGFLPLLAAPLVPYKTVGLFLCAIMALSGMVTLMALPAILRLGQRWLFRPAELRRSTTCDCGFCLILGTVAVILIAVNLHQYWHLGWTRMGVLSAVAIPLLVLTCGILSRRQACRRAEVQGAQAEQAQGE